MAAVWPAGPLPMITSLLCIFLAPAVALPCMDPAVDASPAVVVFFWFTDAATAKGKEIEDRKVRALARRKVDENSLAVLCLSGVVWSKSG